MSETLTTKQVAEHNTVEKGLYVIIDSNVYKLDTFVEEHPGGSKILKRVGGKDASKQFWKVRSRKAVSTAYRVVIAMLLHILWRIVANPYCIVPQRERVEEVRAKVKGRYCQGGSQTIDVQIQIHNYLPATTSKRSRSITFPHASFTRYIQHLFDNA